RAETFFRRQDENHMVCSSQRLVRDGEYALGPGAGRAPGLGGAAAVAPGGGTASVGVDRESGATPRPRSLPGAGELLPDEHTHGTPFGFRAALVTTPTVPHADNPGSALHAGLRKPRQRCDTGPAAGEWPFRPATGQPRRIYPPRGRAGVADGAT